MHEALRETTIKIGQSEQEHQERMSNRVYEEILLLLGQARKYLNLEDYHNVKKYYDEVRDLYLKLSPELRGKVHSEVLNMREEVMKKFYASKNR